MALSIRWRLTLWYGLVLAVALATFAAAVYFTQRHHALQRVDQGLSEELADVLSEVKRADADAGLGVMLNRRFYGHQGFDFQITRRDGSRYFVNRRLADAGASLPLPEEGRSSGTPSYRGARGEGERRWRVVSVEARGPSGPLTVQVARGLEDFDHESR